MVHWKPNSGQFNTLIIYLFDHSLFKDYTLTLQMKSKKKFLFYILLTSGIWFKVDHIILVTNYPYISQNSQQNRLYFNHMLDVCKTVSFDLCSLQLSSITTTITHENYHVVSVCAWALDCVRGRGSWPRLDPHSGS